jgi:tRNA pseudouridine32 synthase/23S rRNA pseudouridine746 synthase
MDMINSIVNTFIHPLFIDVRKNKLPTKFTFPFYYEPSEIAIIAAKDLQKKLVELADLEHNFGLNPSQEGLVIGKMFGVLIVEIEENKFGYLAAFSGKLANANHHEGFVPPVFDLLDKQGFYLEEEKSIVSLTSIIEQKCSSANYQSCQEKLSHAITKNAEEINTFKNTIKSNKAKRDERRRFAHENLNSEELKELLVKLSEESREEQLRLKYITRKNKESIAQIQNELNIFELEILQLKELRQHRSNELQRRIFENYTFLNAVKSTKSLLEIFDNQSPPAGAGECCAPKLLQFAYIHNLKPISMAEFWWGASPASEIRVHKNFYPACKGKCGPILQHMLKGLQVDANPMFEPPKTTFLLQVLYEDQEILVINKPEEFLSVPGIEVKDSVYERIKSLYPDATGPLLVHRLDMSTSGILLIAKTKQSHKKLQSQFIKKTIKKEYTAIVEGELSAISGTIELPLRLDIDDRPRQVVCYEHGKNAHTTWELMNQNKNLTRIKLYPKTGRTHQLRVHAAHPMGLNAPILGDDLYGKKSNRLYLHASAIEFRHPTSNEMMRIESSPAF